MVKEFECVENTRGISWCVWMKKTQVARILAYVTGMVNQQLLLQNEYLIAENRILRSHLPARLRLTNPQRATLATIAK